MNLFETKIQEDKLHDYFKLIRSEKEFSKVREVIQSWGDGLLQRNGEGQKFVNEFQTTFNSAFWELYLNKVFIEMGFHIDYSKNSPDFCLSTVAGYEFCVEAVIADRSKNDTIILDENNFKASNTIKLAGKIKDKRDLYIGLNGKKHPYSSLEHVSGRPFIIAIAPFNSDMSLMQNNEIINRILFGIDTPDDDSVVHGRQKKISSITKQTGAEIKLGIFTNDSHKEISAVIFSTTGTFGKALVESGSERIIRSTRYRVNNKFSRDSENTFNKSTIKTYHNGYLSYLAEIRFNTEAGIFGSDINICHSSRHKETHFDGLHVYYNPFAEFPLDENIFFPPEVTHNFYDIKEDIPIQNHPDGALVSRQLFEPSREIYDYLISMNSKEMLYKSYISRENFEI